MVDGKAQHYHKVMPDPWITVVIIQTEECDVKCGLYSMITVIITVH